MNPSSCQRTGEVLERVVALEVELKNLREDISQLAESIRSLRDESLRLFWRLIFLWLVPVAAWLWNFMQTAR